MKLRTTIEIDEELLDRAKRAIGAKTTRATVAEALRRMADAAEAENRDRGARQQRYLRQLSARADVDLLASGEMWR
jgi:Arc/MetJ family transcription regulator